MLENAGAKKTLDPVYCKRVFRQLKFTDKEIDELLKEDKSTQAGKIEAGGTQGRSGIG
jgi:hypothetical protein